MKEILEQFCINDANNKVVDLTTMTGKKLIRGFRASLESLEWLEGEDVLFGAISFFGTMHHVTCVRVTEDRFLCQVGTNDPHNRLDDVLAGSEGAGETVELPGFEGRWVIGIDPFRD